MAQGVDPIAALAVRVAFATVALAVVYEFSSRSIQSDHSAWTTEVILKTLEIGVIGLGVGMTLLMFALQGGRAGIVLTVSSTPHFFLTRSLGYFSSSTGIRRMGWREHCIFWNGARLYRG